MATLVEKPKQDWTVTLRCKGNHGCGYTYRYGQSDLWVSSFKVSGYHFDGSAVCKDKIYVRCGNCKRPLFVQPPNEAARTATRDG